MQLEEPGETETEPDLDMNTNVEQVWVEVSESGTTHFCLTGTELRLLNDVYVLPMTDTAGLQLGSIGDLPEGSMLIWSRDERQVTKDAPWEQVSVTDTQVDFTVKLQRSRVLTLLNLTEQLVTPRHIKGSIGQGAPRASVAGLTLFSRSLLAVQVVPVYMQNITLPASNSHMHSYLSSHSSSRDLACMAFLKAVMLRQAATRLAQKQGVTQADLDHIVAGEVDKVAHEDEKVVQCISKFMADSLDICQRLDAACSFLDLSALLLAWLRTEQTETDERRKANVKALVTKIIMSYFKLGPYAASGQMDLSSAYRYTLPTTSLPEDLLQPLSKLLEDVDQVNLPAKTCNWDGFLPNYSSLISDSPPRVCAFFFSFFEKKKLGCVCVCVCRSLCLFLCLYISMSVSVLVELGVEPHVISLRIPWPRLSLPRSLAHPPSPQQFREEVEDLSFTAALQRQPTAIDDTLDPTSLRQSQLLLGAESAIELFNIFFVRCFANTRTSERTCDAKPRTNERTR